MLLRRQNVFLGVCTSLCVALTTGCSGPDALTLHNDCAYTIKVYNYQAKSGDSCSKKGELVATLPGNSSDRFTIGFRLRGNPCIAIKKEDGKLLGWLNIDSPDVRQHGRINGAVEFEATIRPPEVETLTASPLAAGLRTPNP